MINRHSFWRNLLLIWYNNDAFGMNWSVTAVLIIESFSWHVSIEGIQWLDELLKGLWTLAQKGKWNKIIGKVGENIERTDIQKKRCYTDLADDQDHLLIGGELVPGDGGGGVGVSQAGEGDHLFYIGGDGNDNGLFLHDCLHHPNCWSSSWSSW